MDWDDIGASLESNGELTASTGEWSSVIQPNLVSRMVEEQNRIEQ